MKGGFLEIVGIYVVYCFVVGEFWNCFVIDELMEGGEDIMELLFKRKVGF